MHDLNLNLFYKTSFDAEAVEDADDVLWELVLGIRAWICGKWKHLGEPIPYTLRKWSLLKNGVRADLGSENGSVRLSSARMDEDGSTQWACSIEETFREPDVAPRQWVTEVGFTQTGERTGRVSIVLSWGDRPGFVGPVAAEPGPSVPNLVLVLSGRDNLVCTVDGIPITLDPIELSAQDAETFWELASRPGREAPVVLVCPRFADDEDAHLAVDPTKLARALGSSAPVFFSRDRGFQGALAHVVDDRAFECRPGTIRIYEARPRFDEPGDSRRHRFFTVADIDSLGEERIILTIRRALAQDVDFYERMTRVGDIRRARRLQHVRLAAEQSVAQVSLDAAEAMRQADEATLEDLLELEAERNSYRDQVEELKRQNHNLEARVDSLGRAGTGARHAAPSLGSWPLSTREIAEMFLASFPDRIDFTERGRASLDECRAGAETSWNALYDIVTILHGLYTGPRNVDIRREFESRSRFEFAAGAGTMTRKDRSLMRGYQDVYQGREISCEAHIKRGSDPADATFIRVYFAFDQTTGKIVISMFGEHLDNATTRTLH